MEYDFCIILHEKLKDKIRGRVFTKVIDDVLLVRIDMDDLWFELTYQDFVNSVMLGYLTSDKVVDEVCKKYRKFLWNKMENYYFKKEEL